MFDPFDLRLNFWRQIKFVYCSKNYAVFIMDPTTLEKSSMDANNKTKFNL